MVITIQPSVDCLTLTLQQSIVFVIILYSL